MKSLRLAENNEDREDGMTPELETADTRDTGARRQNKQSKRNK